MKIEATEYYRKGKLLPFVSWKIDSVTTFGNYQVEFDFPNRRVVRSTDVDSKVIAEIHDRHKGAKLPDFFGTVESDDFVVTKRKEDWLSGFTGNVIFEITLKNCGISFTKRAMRYDFDNSFSLKDILDLRLTRDDRNHNYRFKIQGTCAADHQDLGEVIASLLLHHNEEQSASPG